MLQPGEVLEQSAHARYLLRLPEELPVGNSGWEGTARASWELVGPGDHSFTSPQGFLACTYCHFTVDTFFFIPSFVSIFLSFQEKSQVWKESRQLFEFSAAPLSSASDSHESSAVCLGIPWSLPHPQGVAQHRPELKIPPPSLTPSLWQEDIYVSGERAGRKGDSPGGRRGGLGSPSKCQGAGQEIE